MVNVILKYLPIALFLSNNHPEMYCIHVCSGLMGKGSIWRVKTYTGDHLLQKDVILFLGLCMYCVLLLRDQRSVSVKGVGGVSSTFGEQCPF